MIAVLCSVYQVHCHYHLALVAGRMFLLLGVSGNFWLNADVMISSIWILCSIFNDCWVLFWQAFVYLSLVWSFWGLFLSFVREGSWCDLGLTLRWGPSRVSVEPLNEQRVLCSLAVGALNAPGLWAPRFPYSDTPPTQERLQGPVMVSGALFLCIPLLSGTLLCSLQTPQAPWTLASVSSTQPDGHSSWVPPTVTVGRCARREVRAVALAPLPSSRVTVLRSCCPVPVTGIVSFVLPGFPVG